MRGRSWAPFAIMVAMDKHLDRLVWLDLEMTGLDPLKDVILEIATAVTDADLNVLAEGPVLAVHQPDRVLAKMDPWCVRQHGRSGLTERVRTSAVSLKKAEELTLDFLRAQVPEGKIPLCGNTIGQDRRFLVRYMPRLQDFFHYRSIDVSTVKELAKRWYPNLPPPPPKRQSHKAIEDVLDSIRELQYYREKVFRR